MLYISSDFHGKKLTISFDIIKLLPPDILKIISSLVYLIVYLSVSVLSIIFMWKFGFVVMVKVLISK